MTEEDRARRRAMTTAPIDPDSIDWLCCLYWVASVEGEWSQEWMDVYLVTTGLFASSTMYQRACRQVERWIAAGRPDVRPALIAAREAAAKA